MTISVGEFAHIASNTYIYRNSEMSFMHRTEILITISISNQIHLKLYQNNYL